MSQESDPEEVRRKLKAALERVSFTSAEVAASFGPGAGKITKDTMFQSKAETTALEFARGRLRFKPETIEKMVNKYAAVGMPKIRMKDRPEKDPFWNFKQNIADSAGQLARWDVTLPQYMLACAKNPDLLKEHNIYGKISDAARAFAAYGVDTRGMVRMHMGHPNNFSQRPNTKKDKFEAVVKTFARKGLTSSQYMEAVLAEPSLLANDAEKNIRNIGIILDAYDSGRLIIKNRPHSRGSLSAQQWYEPIFNLICHAPQVICRSTETLEKRLEEAGNSRALFDSNEQMGIQDATTALGALAPVKRVARMQPARNIR